MSAAATAAGYLYASGRLRAKNKEEGERPEKRHEAGSQRAIQPRERELRVAVVHREERPKKEPKIQYRTRRWKPE